MWNVIKYIVTGVAIMLVGSVTVSALIGYSVDSIHKAEQIRDAIEQCEKSLPRDQVCTYTIVAEPKA